MSTWLPRSTTANGVTIALLIAAAALAFSASAPAQEQAPAATQTPEAQAGDDAVSAIPEARQFYRDGVRLYKENKYAEALNKFNRALALDPSMEEAKLMVRRCEGKIQIAASGRDAAEIPEFETPFSEGVRDSEGNVQIPTSAEDVKLKQIKELMAEGQNYLDHKKFRRAVKVFDRLLLIAPDNQTAQRLLQEATVGAYDEQIEDVWQDLGIQAQAIRHNIESKKLIPEGYDADGMRRFAVRLPVEEELGEEAMTLEDQQRSYIEKALDSPVAIDMDDEMHVSELLQLFSDFVQVSIVLDERVVAPPRATASQQTATQQPGAFPQQQFPGTFPQQQFPGQAQNPFLQNRLNQRNPLQRNPLNQQNALSGDQVTDGYVRYTRLDDMKLRDALMAILRPMNLSYVVRPTYIWVSTPEKIRTEALEPLETRVYELRNIGAEILPKVVVTNRGGMTGSVGGGNVGSRNMGSNLGSSNLGSRNMGGNLGSSNLGGNMGSRNMGGNLGGSRMGGGGSGQFSNILELVRTVDSSQVGEEEAGIMITAGRTGAGDRRPQTTGQTQQPGGTDFGMSESYQYEGGGAFLDLIGELIPAIREPASGQALSYMIYLPTTNLLLVHNTPTNLDEFEKLIEELDVTPKQVSIESKFITVSVTDLDKIGFNWDLTMSDLNDKTRAIPDLLGGETTSSSSTTTSGTSTTTTSGSTYDYDINGDGVLESIPFYTRPDGTSVIDNTLAQTAINGLVNPGPTGDFNISTIFTDNEDGDSLGVTMDFLNSLTEGELLSAPRVTTMNRKPAIIADFLTQTYQTQVYTELQTSVTGISGTSTGGLSTQGSYSQFVFGITFSVTPMISGTDHVRLWLNPQVISKVGDDEFTQTSQLVGGTETTSTIRYPRTSVQSVWTNVIVHDGDTLVLGGLVSDRTTKNENKLPYVANLPVLGYLFRGKSTEVTQSSLLIFVTVDIIDPMGARFFEAGV